MGAALYATTYLHSTQFYLSIMDVNTPSQGSCYPFEVSSPTMHA